MGRSLPPVLSKGTCFCIPSLRQARAASQEEKRVSLSCVFGARLGPRVFRGPAASQFPPRPAPFTCEGRVL